MTTNTYLLFTVVAIHLPFFAVSMQTDNGYLCNLCHSLENEYPYPPPTAESRIVRFSKAEDEEFGMPWSRGSTCLEVWNKVLDFANPNIKDETSCRSMAKAYASQCCNDFIEKIQDNSDEKQIQEESIEDQFIEGTTNVAESSLAKRQLFRIFSRLSNERSEKTKRTRPTTDRLSTSSMATGREADENGENKIADRFSRADPQSLIVSNESSGARERLSSSTMGTGRYTDINGDGDRNIRRTASVSYLRGKL